MKNIFALLFCLAMAALLLMAGCSGSKTKTYSDPATEISVKAGREFIIALKANATTGFSWEAAFDESMLQLVSQNYMPDDNKEGMVGVGGTDHFRFKALASGITRAELTYRQPWAEGEGEYGQRLTFMVEIK